MRAIFNSLLSRLTSHYRGRGSAAHHPSVLLALLVYGYATGVFSSRNIERATYDSVAFRFLSADTHPDHDTLAHFRKTFLVELEDLFVQVLSLAQAMKLVKLGQISLDGTKIKANAFKHKALSHGHIETLDAQLRDEVQALLQHAAETDTADARDDLDLPDELARREQRLQALAEANTHRAQEPRSPSGLSRATNKPRKSTKTSWIAARPNGKPAKSRRGQRPRPLKSGRRPTTKST